MFTRKRYFTRSTIIAIALHVVVMILFFIGFQTSHQSVSDNMEAPIDIVQAQVIDGAAIDAEKRRIREEQEALAQKKRDEALRKKKQQEEKARQEKEQREKAEQQRLAEIKQAEIAKQKADLAREQAELARKQAQEEQEKAKQAQLRAEQERKKAEDEAKRLAAELEKQEELKRQAQKQAEIEAEEKRLADILAQEEAELRAAEQQAKQAARQRQLNTLLSEYVGAINAKVTSRWRRPPSLELDNSTCVVYVRQATGGFIEEVRVLECSGNSDVLKRSVEEAVWKSDPLPTPADDELFQKELKLTFKLQ